MGYLLKDRVFDGAVLADALHRLVAGETVVDPTIVSRLLGRRRARDPLEALSEREREVLALVAEGLSNTAIAARLVAAERTVESTCGHPPAATPEPDACGSSHRPSAPRARPAASCRRAQVLFRGHRPRRSCARARRTADQRSTACSSAPAPPPVSTARRRGPLEERERVLVGVGRPDMGASRAGRIARMVHVQGGFGVVPLDVFVGARLAEDAATAHAAAGTGRWTAHSDTGMGEWYVDSDETGSILSTGYVTEAHAGPYAEHIARHDPDRVLADVSARRRVLTEYQRSAGVRKVALAVAVKAIAATYADHPDYSPVWRLW